jgi:hypothetical protein
MIHLIRPCVNSAHSVQTRYRVGTPWPFPRGILPLQHTMLLGFTQGRFHPIVNLRTIPLSRLEPDRLRATQLTEIPFGRPQHPPSCVPSLAVTGTLSDVRFAPFFKFHFSTGTYGQAPIWRYAIKYAFPLPGKNRPRSGAVEELAFDDSYLRLAGCCPLACIFDLRVCEWLRLQARFAHQPGTPTQPQNRTSAGWYTSTRCLRNLNGTHHASRLERLSVSAGEESRDTVVSFARTYNPVVSRQTDFVNKVIQLLEK